MALLDDRRRRKSLSMAICQIKASACCRRAREVSGDRLCGSVWEGGASDWWIPTQAAFSLFLALFISVVMHTKPIVFC